MPPHLSAGSEQPKVEYSFLVDSFYCQMYQTLSMLSLSPAYVGFTEKVINILIVNTIRWLFADFIC